MVVIVWFWPILRPERPECRQILANIFVFERKNGKYEMCPLSGSTENVYSKGSLTTGEVTLPPSDIKPKIVDHPALRMR